MAKKKTEPLELTIPAKVVSQLKKIDSNLEPEALALKLLTEQITLYNKLYSDTKGSNNINISLSKPLCKKFYEDACNDEGTLKKKIVFLMEGDIHFMQYTLPRMSKENQKFGWKHEEKTLDTDMIS